MLWGNRTRLQTIPIDYDLGLIRIDGTGEPIATLVSFTCHPVIPGPDNLFVTAGYNGAIMHIVEEDMGGMVMFLQGGFRRH